MSRSTVWTGACLVLLTVSPACVVSRSAFDERTNALQQELEAERRRGEALEGAVSELLVLRDDTAEAERVRGLFAERLDRMESERSRLAELEAGLAAQTARLGELAALFEELRQSPPLQRITSLEREVADLEARVTVGSRMTMSNRETLDETIRRLDRHVAEFERQMTLLGEYVRDQFVPLAEGLVNHLYEESRRLQENAQGLGEFARKVDPFKFKHLQPGYTESQPPPASKDE